VAISNKKKQKNRPSMTYRWLILHKLSCTSLKVCKVNMFLLFAFSVDSSQNSEHFGTFSGFLIGPARDPLEKRFMRVRRKNCLTHNMVFLAAIWLTTTWLFCTLRLRVKPQKKKVGVPTSLYSFLRCLLRLFPFFYD
jgi:hypothetical protein